MFIHLSNQIWNMYTWVFLCVCVCVYFMLLCVCKGVYCAYFELVSLNCRPCLFFLIRIYGFIFSNARNWPQGIIFFCAIYAHTIIRCAPVRWTSMAASSRGFWWDVYSNHILLKKDRQVVQQVLTSSKNTEMNN